MRLRSKSLSFRKKGIRKRNKKNYKRSLKSTDCVGGQPAEPIDGPDYV